MAHFELTTSSGLITKEALEKLKKIASDVSCECPGHLIEIYHSIQAFTEYQKQCISQKPQDEMIHRWLESTSVNMEHILSNTIVTLARMEGMIDDKNQVRSEEE
jgi:hypothetical protein